MHTTNTTNVRFSSDYCNDIISDILSETTAYNSRNLSQSNGDTIINESPYCLEDCINQLFDVTDDDPILTIDDKDQGTNEITEDDNQQNNIGSHKLVLVPILKKL